MSLPGFTAARSLPTPRRTYGRIERSDVLATDSVQPQMLICRCLGMNSLCLKLGIEERYCCQYWDCSLPRLPTEPPR